MVKDTGVKTVIRCYSGNPVFVDLLSYLELFPVTTILYCLFKIMLRIVTKSFHLAIAT